MNLGTISLADGLYSPLAVGAALVEIVGKRARIGWKFWAAAWCIPMCCAPAASSGHVQRGARRRECGRLHLTGLRSFVG